MNELEPGDLLRQVVAIGRAAEAIVLHARVAERQLRVLLQEAAKTADGAPVPASPVVAPDAGAAVSEETVVVVECKCPANRRQVAPIPGVPTRTRCRVCSKFHV